MTQRERHWVVDSIEESAASVELDDGTMITIPRSQLPAAAKQGDVLRVSIDVDAAATKAAYDRSAAQMKGRKPTNDPGGDITL
jgi:hypothetical protein